LYDGGYYHTTSHHLAWLQSMYDHCTTPTSLILYVDHATVAYQSGCHGMSEMPSRLPNVCNHWHAAPITALGCTNHLFTIMSKTEPSRGHYPPRCNICVFTSSILSRCNGIRAVHYASLSSCRRRKHCCRICCSAGTAISLARACTQSHFYRPLLRARARPRQSTLCARF
jgi:hypothetical protein